MNDKLIEVITQIQTMAPMLWESAIRAELATGVVGLVFAAVMLYGASRLARATYRYHHSEKYPQGEIMVGGVTAAVILISVAVTLLYQGVIHLVAPEYMVLKALLP